MEVDETGNTASDIVETGDDSDEYLEYHEHHEYHDYSEDDAATKMHHLMHSDTIIVVFSLVVMIMVGLVFRSLCMKLTSINQRKERVRGGLKQMAESMNYVTRYGRIIHIVILISLKSYNSLDIQPETFHLKYN